MEKGFYARVSRLGSQWLELDLHFLSLGGGEIALGWWFEECLVPYLVNTSKLEAVQSISIVTGYGKTRSRGARMNDDGMRLRVKAMLKYMGIQETPQPNKGRIHINKSELIDEVKKNGGKIVFDMVGYTRFKAEETTANKFPDVPQRVRARFRPARPGEGPPGTFIREGGGEEIPSSFNTDDREVRREPPARQADSYQEERRESRLSPHVGDDRTQHNSWQQERRGTHGERSTQDRGFGGFDDRRGHDRRGHYDDDPRGVNSYGRDREFESRRFGDYHEPRGSNIDTMDTRANHVGQDRRDRQDMGDRRGSYREWEHRGDRRSSHYERDRDRVEDPSRRSFQRPPLRDSYYGEDRPMAHDADFGRGPPRDYDVSERRPSSRDVDMPDRHASFESGPVGSPSFSGSRSGPPPERAAKRQRHSFQQFGEPSRYDHPRQKRVSDSVLYMNRREGGISSEVIKQFATIKEDPEAFGDEPEDPLQQHAKKRGFDDDQKPAANRGYNIEPSYAAKRRLP